MRLLTFTTLYPNEIRPGHGVFVENRLRHLVAGGEAESLVVAPVPWFPLRSAVFGGYADFARVPRIEDRSGIAVHHPRYPVLPKVGMSVAPALLYRGALASVRRILAAGYDFDLIDAHYFYPDGVAAAMLGRRLGKPVVITARGSDINAIARFAGPRRTIRQAAAAAAGVIAVSEALRGSLCALGVDPAKVVTLRNGVDVDRFAPVDTEAVRRRLGLTGPVIATVGNLLAAKGQHLVLRAMPDFDGATLLVAGTGPARAELGRLAEELGVAGRVRFLGHVPHEELRQVYGVADVSVLASASEGWPNVVLESMACGTPVVATDVGGISEIIGPPESGTVLAERTAAAIAAAVGRILARPPARAAARAHAERFGWDEITTGQLALFGKILGTPAGIPTAALQTVASRP